MQKSRASDNSLLKTPFSFDVFTTKNHSAIYDKARCVQTNAYQSINLYMYM